MRTVMAVVVAVAIVAGVLLLPVIVGGSYRASAPAAGYDRERLASVANGPGVAVPWPASVASARRARRGVAD